MTFLQLFNCLILISIISCSGKPSSTTNNMIGNLELAILKQDIKAVEANIGEINKELADPNKPGWKPLHLISSSRENASSKTIIKMLIANKANLNDQCNIGYTPLMRAVESKHWQHVEVLIINGAKTDVKNNFGTDVFDIAGKDSKTLKKIIGNVTKRKK